MFFPFADDNPTRRTPVLTYGLLAINTAVFLWWLQLAPERRQETTVRHGFIPARIAQLAQPKPLQVVLQQPGRDPLFHRPVMLRRQFQLDPNPVHIGLSLLTCMFMHGGWMHLIGNMWFLWIFGNNVEDRLGHGVFLLFYLSGGVLASACHWLTDPTSTTPVIGASGAVAAVLGGYAITWPWARVHTLIFLVFFITVIDVPALIVLGVWFLGQLLEGNRAAVAGAEAGVAWWAHVGGFVAGALLMPLLSAISGAEDDAQTGWFNDDDDDDTLRHGLRGGGRRPPDDPRHEPRW